MPPQISGGKSREAYQNLQASSALALRAACGLSLFTLLGSPKQQVVAFESLGQNLDRHLAPYRH